MTRRLRAVVIVLVVVVLGCLLALSVSYLPWQHWLAVHTGTEYGGPDKYYNFWSGFGADLGEVTLITTVGLGVYTGVRKVNCHVKGCWRIGHHALDGTPYHLCARHHPDVPGRGATHAQILEHHHRALRERVGHPTHPSSVPEVPAPAPAATTPGG